MDHAIITGGDVAPMEHDVVVAMHEVLDKAGRVWPLNSFLLINRTASGVIYYICCEHSVSTHSVLLLYVKCLKENGSVYAHSL